MPIIRGQDGDNPYYKYSGGVKKYYYTAHSKRSRDYAYKKAVRQMRVIRGKNK
jgi:hypothetical protein